MDKSTNAPPPPAPSLSLKHHARAGLGRRRLFALLAPHLNNEGGNNTGWLGSYKGVEMFFAENGDIALAMACSSKWIKRSVGYVGTSDGWLDIRQHGELKWQYDSATKGNIACTGEIDVTEKELVLAISFGRTHTEAANHARASILNGFEVELFLL